MPGPPFLWPKDMSALLAELWVSSPGDNCSLEPDIVRYTAPNVLFVHAKGADFPFYTYR